MPHAPVSERQLGTARRLRQTMTRAETLLWRYLKANHLNGLSFRRQTPVGVYIADFVCHAAKLIVEIDGETHDFIEAQKRDSVRDQWLSSRGYAVLRFANEDVLHRLEGVLTTIAQTAASRLEGAPPSLSLPRKGGGNAKQQASAQAAAKKRTAGDKS